MSCCVGCTSENYVGSLKDHILVGEGEGEGVELWELTRSPPSICQHRVIETISYSLVPATTAQHAVVFADGDNGR